MSTGDTSHHTRNNIITTVEIPQPNKNQPIAVNVCGQLVTVIVGRHQSLVAVAQDARWQTGYGSTPPDNWEMRDEDGRLLSDDWPARYAFPEQIFVNQKPGIGA